MSTLYEDLMEGLEEILESQKSGNHPTGSACRLLAMIDEVEEIAELKRRIADVKAGRSTLKEHALIDVE